MEVSKGWKIGIAIILIGIIALSSIIISINLPKTRNIPQPESAPVLENLGITFGNYSEETSRAGSFLFTKHEDLEKIFVEFGENTYWFFGNYYFDSIGFEFLVDKNTNIYAPCDGVINDVRYRQELQTYELTIVSEAETPWFVNLGFIVNLTVSEGDEVEAGDIIAKPWDFYEGLGRYGLWIGYINREDNSETFYAPFKLFDLELRQEYEAKLWQLMKDWEDFKHNWTLYNQESMVYAGCLNETINL
jgi:hypothetical protein